VVPRRKPLILANVLLDIVSMDTQKVEQIRAQSKKRVRELFNLAVQKTAFLDFYKTP
jgi:muconolactone delta-isomerase